MARLRTPKADTWQADAAAAVAATTAAATALWRQRGAVTGDVRMGRRQRLQRERLLLRAAVAIWVAWRSYRLERELTSRR